MNKKGVELAVRTLVIIVLSVLILIALIVVFTNQSEFFVDFLNNLVGKTNVDSLVTSCNSLVTQNSVYEYCCVKRNVKYEQDGEMKGKKLTCLELSEKNFTAGRIQELNCDDAGC